MKIAIKNVAAAILLSSVCTGAFASTSWTQDEIIVKPKGGDVFGNVIPNELAYKFSYNGDELSAVNMLFKTGDSGYDDDSIYNAIVGSHYFKYETDATGEKRLKAIMLFSQGLDRVSGSKDSIAEKYSLTTKVKSPTFPMAGKWILVVSERDESDRATVVNKFGIDTSLLYKMQRNVSQSKQPLDGIDFDDPSIGSPIGAFVITYTDLVKTDFKEVKTYSLISAQCSTCPPPPVNKPIKNYQYEPKISYVWDYKSNGDFITTFNYMMADALQGNVVPFYQQEIKIEDINPDSGRVKRIIEYANNIYNLSHKSQPTPMYEYILKDESRSSTVVDEYLFGLSMMGIGVQQEESRDINFSSIISSSPDSGANSGDNFITDLLVSYLDKRFNGLGSLVSQVASFGPSAN